jgi:hypothetical protein
VKRFTHFYLNNKLDHLAVKEILPSMLVVGVDKATSSVVRGVILTEEGGCVRIYAVDEGRLALFPHKQLFVTTKDAALVRFKVSNCLKYHSSTYYLCFEIWSDI